MNLFFWSWTSSSDHKNPPWSWSLSSDYEHPLLVMNIFFKSWTSSPHYEHPLLVVNILLWSWTSFSDHVLILLIMKLFFWSWTSSSDHEHPLLIMNILFSLWTSSSDQEYLFLITGILFWFWTFFWSQVFWIMTTRFCSWTSSDCTYLLITNIISWSQNFAEFPWSQTACFNGNLLAIRHNFHPSHKSECLTFQMRTEKIQRKPFLFRDTPDKHYLPSGNVQRNMIHIVREEKSTFFC